MHTDLFPVFLKLANRRVLLVGGGEVAAAKLAGLRRAGARVTVVAPEIGPGIAGDGQWLVVSAATPAVNRQVARAAERKRLFVNAVDDPAHASAYLGGVCRRAGVTVAVSTDGHAPALAGLLREGLEAVLPEDLGRWVAIGRRARRGWKARRVPMPERRPLLLEALNRLYEERPVE
jgi:siroheme synthase-like protein